MAVAVLLASGCGGVSQADIDAAVAEALAEQAAVTTTAAATTAPVPTVTTAPTAEPVATTLYGEATWERCEEMRARGELIDSDRLGEVMTGAIALRQHTEVALQEGRNPLPYIVREIEAWAWLVAEYERSERAGCDPPGKPNRLALHRESLNERVAYCESLFAGPASACLPDGEQ